MLLEIIMPTAEFNSLPTGAGGRIHLPASIFSDLSMIVEDQYPHLFDNGHDLYLSPVAVRNYMSALTGSEFISVVMQAAAPDDRIVYIGSDGFGNDDDLFLPRLLKEYEKLRDDLVLLSGKPEAQFQTISEHTTSKASAIICAVLLMNHMIAKVSGHEETVVVNNVAPFTTADGLLGSEGAIWVSLGHTAEAVRRDLMSVSVNSL